MKKKRSANHTLGNIFNQIATSVYGNQFQDSHQFRALMARWLNDPKNGIPRKGKIRSTAQGNLAKQLRSPEMTWNVLIKALQFLGATDMDIQITLHWGDKSTTHEIAVCLDEIDPSGEDMSVDDYTTEEPNPTQLAFRRFTESTKT